MILAVNAGVPVRTLAEFLAWTKPRNAGVNDTRPGAGKPQDLATDLFRQSSRLALGHIPYRSPQSAEPDMVGGQVPFRLVSMVSGYPHILAGTLRPIGVASPRRALGYNTTPTLAEQGTRASRPMHAKDLSCPSRRQSRHDSRSLVLSGLRACRPRWLPI